MPSKVISALEQKQASVSTVAGATSTLIQFQVPPGLQFEITDFGNDVDTAAAFGNITWQILRNGCPQAPVDKQLDRLGDLITPMKLGRPIQFNGGDLVEVIAINAGGVTYKPAALIKGQYYRIVRD